MLGWDVRVYREPKVPGGERILLANWDTSVFGTSWIDDLVKQGKAQDLGGDGYPCVYKAPAAVLLPVLRHGLPRHASPPVFGDDYATPAGWSGKLKLNEKEAAACAGDEMLTVEAWDLS